MLRSSSLALLVAGGALAAATYAPPAQACGGGMFYDVGEQETVSVAAHDVVVSISKTRTVLWDRISYTGAPTEFAWVMPVNAGAKLEVAASAWIEALVGGTTPVVRSPYAECFEGGGSGSSGGCCGSALKDGGTLGGGGGGTRGGGEQDDVTVVHRGTVGPYDTATIKSDTPGAIGKWLTDNGYAIPASVQPILDDYAAKGMEFLAVRLQPDKGVQDMAPLRVIMDGMLTTFPMRMLSAGAKDKVPIRLVLLAEGRYEAKGFASASVDPSQVSWDFTKHTSDYAAQRAAVLAKNGGATWLTSFASRGGLLAASAEAQGQPFALDEQTQAQTLGALYYARGKANTETLQNCTSDRWGTSGDSSGEVVELCADTTMPCSKLMTGQIDARDFACGELTDLSTALVGMHPSSVWISRLEAELPVAALAADLTLVPAAAQTPLSHFVDAGKQTGDPCSGEDSTALRAAGKKPARRASAPLAVLVLGVGCAIARRRSRQASR